MVTIVVVVVVVVDDELGAPLLQPAMMTTIVARAREQDREDTERYLSKRKQQKRRHLKRSPKTGDVERVGDAAQRHSARCDGEVRCGFQNCARKFCARRKIYSREV